MRASQLLQHMFWVVQNCGWPQKRIYECYLQHLVALRLCGCSVAASKARSAANSNHNWETLNKYKKYGVKIDKHMLQTRLPRGNFYSIFSESSSETVGSPKLWVVQKTQLWIELEALWLERGAFKGTKCCK